MDKKSLIYIHACSNESCCICFTQTPPKFLFIATMFIAISDRSSTSTDLRSNHQPPFVTNLYLLDVAGVVDLPIKTADKVNISLFFCFISP